MRDIALPEVHKLYKMAMLENKTGEGCEGRGRDGGRDVRGGGGEE